MKRLYALFLLLGALCIVACEEPLRRSSSQIDVTGSVRFFVSTFQEHDMKGKSRHEVKDEHGQSGTERSRA